MNFYKLIKADLNHAKVLLGGSRIALLYYVFDFGFGMLLIYRLSSCLRGCFLKYILLHIAFERVQSVLFGVHMPPQCKIGAGCVIFHGYGIVLNPSAKLGENVVLYHRVTIGQRFPGDRSPEIGDHVIIGCGATVLGPCKIEDGARLKANSLTLPNR